VTTRFKKIIHEAVLPKNSPTAGVINLVMKSKTMFITRNYPPQVGGLESYSYNLIHEFEAHEVTYKIVHTKSKNHLVWFIPYCLLKALFLSWKHAITSIHLCDALLAPVGVLLKSLTPAKVSITVHGLDITYGNRCYQTLIPWCVARLDQVVCVSRSTRKECTRRGIPNRLCRVIPNGVRPDEFYLVHSRDALRRELGKILDVSLQDKTVLATVGRLVERKGIAWFAENVMPHLDTSYYYIIAGDGPEYKYIQAVLDRNNLQGCVFLLGRVSDETKKVIYNASDIFIMPNITVPGDIEGFGIVAIEAASCGLPVVASRIQGIQDAVLDGMTGYLVEERDVEGFLKKIETMDLDKESVRSVVTARFDWKYIFRHYRIALMGL
jgi:glycosyltransferase involved in cell wall biosynthesis